MLVTAFALLLASPALAADPPEAPAGGAIALYEEGVKLAEKKDYAAAEAKFLAAWAIQRSYDVAANLGEVEMQLDKPAPAAGYFTYALANFPLGGKPQTREWITGRLKEARSKIFALTLSVSVPGAEVRVDGKPAAGAASGEEVFVPAGAVTVDVAAPGYEPWSRKITATAGGSQKLQVDLVQPPKSLVPGLALGGAGIAALLTGVGLYALSTEKYDTARRLNGEIKAETGGAAYPCREPALSPKCAELKSVAAESDALYTPSVALMIGGSLVAAAGGAYLGYAVWPSGAKPTGNGPKVTALGVRGAGVFVEGSF